MELLPAAVSCIPATPLLALPGVLLCDILSWAPDSATANALMNSCPALHALRCNPASAALLLLRCRSADYASAVASCSAVCAGGAAAVVQQVLRHLQGGARSAAPPSLLHAMLQVSAEVGDAESVRALLAMPRQPGADMANVRALVPALQGGHRTGLLQALLEAGALTGAIWGVWDGGGWAVAEAAQTAAGAAVLPLLVQHWPPQHRDVLVPSLCCGLEKAICVGVAEGVPFLLTAIAAAAGGGDGNAADPARWLVAAAKRHSPMVLTAVLNHAPASGAALAEALQAAVCMHQVGCIRLLLGQGAVIGNAGAALLAAAMARVDTGGVDFYLSGDLPPTVEAKYETVELLLEHGAVASPALLKMAAQARVAGLVLLLQRAIASAAAA